MNGITGLHMLSRASCRAILAFLCLFWVLLCPSLAVAQQLDMDILPPKAKSTPSSAKSSPVPAASSIPTMAKPLSATISKTLYLPADMYGQWSVTGTLMETNAEQFFSPVVNDIWVLERLDDKVMISNPANGASAAVNVDHVDGNQATFHRQGPAGRNRFFQEIPTISVSGNVLTGRSVNKIQYIKNGQITREYYAVYGLQATRIGAARTQFKPQDAWEEPDIEIEEVQR